MALPRKRLDIIIRKGSRDVWQEQQTK